MLNALLKPVRFKSVSAGFTLIELMIGVAILAILMGVAVPNFRAWMLNIQIRNASESILNGIQRARAEAVARNTNVAFILGAGSSWTVNVVNPAALIESRSANEGSKSVARTVAPPLATTITFNNVGMVAANTPASAQLLQIDLGLDLNNDTLLDAGNRNLRITLGVGGVARMCDPFLPSSNARGC